MAGNRIPAKISELIRANARCPLLAQSGHLDTLNQCLLLGVKRTLVLHSAMSAFDPKRTSEAHLRRAAQWLLEGAVCLNMDGMVLG